LNSNLDAWLTVLYANVPIGKIKDMVLGGSGVCGGDLWSDTDLFILLEPCQAMPVAWAFQESLANSSDFVGSSITFRESFGVRVRTGAVIDDFPRSCSFFFSEASWNRNTAHERRGISLKQDARWGQCTLATKSFTSSDKTARQQEYADALLELPSLLKHAYRRDYLAASICGSRAAARLVNVVSTIGHDFFSGYDKELSARLEALFPGRTMAQYFVGGADAKSLFQQVLLLTRLLTHALCRQVESECPIGVFKFERVISPCLSELASWLEDNDER